MTGKRLEIPIKRILQGADPHEVVASTALDHPDFLSAFAEYART
jgi:acetoacetyl-CoA synthetase